MRSLAIIIAALALLASATAADAQGFRHLIHTHAHVSTFAQAP